jgi:hypothetical protein
LTAVPDGPNNLIHFLGFVPPGDNGIMDQAAQHQQGLDPRESQQGRINVHFELRDL